MCFSTLVLHARHKIKWLVWMCESDRERYIREKFDLDIYIYVKLGFPTIVSMGAHTHTHTSFKRKYVFWISYDNNLWLFIIISIVFFSLASTQKSISQSQRGQNESAAQYMSKIMRSSWSFSNCTTTGAPLMPLPSPQKENQLHTRSLSLAPSLDILINRKCGCFSSRFHSHIRNLEIW